MLAACLLAAPAAAQVVEPREGAYGDTDGDTDGGRIDDVLIGEVLIDTVLIDAVVIDAVTTTEVVVPDAFPTPPPPARPLPDGVVLVGVPMWSPFIFVTPPAPAP